MLLPLLDHDARLALREGAVHGVLVEGGVIKRRSKGLETSQKKLADVARAMEQPMHDLLAVEGMGAALWDS